MKLTKDLRQAYGAIFFRPTSLFQMPPRPRPTLRLRWRCARGVHPEMQRKPFCLGNFLRSSGAFFGAGVEDVKRRNTTPDALDTTTSRNKKKPTKDLHQTYTAVFLSAMSMFQAIQRRTKKCAPRLCARERYVAGQTMSSKAPPGARWRRTLGEP